MNNETEQIFIINPSEKLQSVASQKTKESPAPQKNLHDVEDFSTVCRTCATVTDFVIPIFEGEGLQNNLAEKICKHLPIQVSPMDVLPLVVCYQCASTLLAWHELVACCAQADAALRTRHAAKQDPETTSEEAGPGPGQQKDRRQSDPADDDTLASQDELDAEDDDRPLSQLVSKKTDLYRNFYDALVGFRNHFVSEHAQRRREFIDSSDSEIASEHEGDADDLNVDNYDDLTQCNMRKDRLDEETRIELSQVQTKINGKAFYTCRICGKNLSSSHTYVFHKRIHTGERPCVCHICGKQFRAPNGLQRHLTETHDRARRHTCGLCLKDFANTQNLKQHLRIHTGERPFVCAHCGKRFTQSGSLHVHLKTHSEQFPHQCAECGAKFRLRTSLTRHSLKHTGERPYVCAQCGKGFRQRHELGRHVLSHSDSKPFTCAVCGAAFRQRRALRHHARRLHHEHTPHDALVYTHANYP